MFANPVAEDGLSTMAAGHGVMLALVPPVEVSQALTVPGGEPAEEGHLTLYYLGSAAKAGGEGGCDRLHAATIDFVTSSGHQDLTGHVNGYGVFYPTAGSDGQYVLWAVWDIPGLDRFRVDLGVYLEHAGFDLSEQAHGFTPHQTICYSPKPITNLPQLPLDIPEVRFTSLVLAWAGQWQHYPLA